MVVLSDAYFAAIGKRAFASSIPPMGLDLLALSGNDLANYGLPARPDPVRESELFQFWARLLSPPFNFIVPQFPSKAVALPRVMFHTLAVRPSGRSRQAPRHVSFGHKERSRNWSGAYITPSRPKLFVLIAGSWNVPTAAMPSVRPVDQTSDGEFRSSAWIGLDGYRSRYPKASLPQIGTSHHVRQESGGAVPEYGVWWQWWKKTVGVGEPENSPVPILNMPAKPGDEVMALMVLPSNDEVRFHFKNQNTGHYCTFLVTAPGSIDPIGSTAEWIFERPTEVGSSAMYPLPHCSPVVFRDCIAQSASSPVLTAPRITQTLHGNGRTIDMVERFANPHRIAVVAHAKKVSSLSARVSYVEAGQKRP